MQESRYRSRATDIYKNERINIMSIIITAELTRTNLECGSSKLGGYGFNYSTP